MGLSHKQYYYPPPIFSVSANIDTSKKINASLLHGDDAALLTWLDYVIGIKAPILACDVTLYQFGVYTLFGPLLDNIPSLTSILCRGFYSNMSEIELKEQNLPPLTRLCIYVVYYNRLCFAW